MATLSSIVRLSRNGVSLISSSAATRTTIGQHFDHRLVTVNTIETVITISTEVGNARELVITNLDPDNFVDWGFATGVYPLRLRPKSTDKIEIAPGTSQLFLLADQDPVQCEIIVHEE